MLGWLVKYEASFKLDERLELQKLSKLLMHKIDGLVQHIAHMVQNVVKQYVWEQSLQFLMS